MQLWPEVSTFVKMTDRTRFYFLATTVKEDGEAASGEFGPNLDIYFRAIGARKHWAGFRLDESKNRTLLVRIGYRYLHNTGDDPEENRGVIEVTPRYPLVRGVLSRIVAGWISGSSAAHIPGVSETGCRSSARCPLAVFA